MRKTLEGAGEFAVVPGEFDGVGAGLPALLGLPQRFRA